MEVQEYASGEDLIKLEKERNAIIVKSNELVQKRQRLTLAEQKLILYLISQIDQSAPDFQWYNFKIAEFCKIVGIDTGGRNYSRIKQILVNLSNKSWYEESEGDEDLGIVRWIEDAKINKATGEVKIMLSKKLRPYLLQLNSKFTQFRLINCLGFKSKYTLALYENICRVHFYELEPYTVRFSLEQTRGLFSLEKNEYADWKDFKRRVLDVACKEVNETSNKTITYQTEIEKKKIAYLVFTISSKDAIEYVKIETQVHRQLNEASGLSTSHSRDDPPKTD